MPKKSATVKETESEKSAFLKKVEELNKKYGEGTLIAGNEIADDVEVVSSGSVTLDIATTIGGLPVGKLIEIFGPESSGKSTITLHIIAEFQKSGKKCVLVDAEQSFDKKYATTLGVKVDDLIYVQPRCGEDGYNIVEGLVRTKEVGLIVIDSHTALVPKKIVDGEVGDSTMALQARLNSTALLKIHPLLKESNCTIVSIAQLRTNIGAYGDPLSPTGGLAYKFYSDMRLKMSKQVDKEAETNKTKVEVIKNKCGVPFGKAEFLINWGTGIDRLQEVIDLAVEKKLIELKGAGWYVVNGEKLQGDEKVKDYLRKNDVYLQEIEKQVL